MLKCSAGGWRIVRKEKILIGALLVAEGVITESQLDEALEAQVLYGGRLGTNLVELGYLDEEALAYFLSEKLNLPYAHPKKLLDLKKKIISLIPRELAEKYKILPFDIKRKKRLRLVMADPQDLDAINDISFTTGYIVEPMVTPEARLLEALELHYEIPRRKRFGPAVESLKESQPDKPPELQKSAPGPGEQAEEKLNMAEDEMSEEIIKEKVEKLKGKRRSMLMGDDAQESRTDDAKENLSSLYQELKNASNRDAVAIALIDFALEKYSSAAILVLKGDRAEGWKGAGAGLNDETVKKVIIPLAVPSVIKDAVDAKFVPRDNPEKRPMDKMLRRLLKIEDSHDICVTSVYFQKVAICFLVVVAPRGSIAEDAKKLFIEAADNAGKAFARLISESRKKERTT